MKILGTYKIEYENGVIQTKNLIIHEDFLNIIKPKQEEAYQLELQKKFEEADKIKTELKSIFGEYWFTDQSPLFWAIDSGFLIVPHYDGCGGTYAMKCILTEQFNNK